MKKLIISTLFIAFCFSANAQFENILAAGEEDLSKYFESYTQPVFKGLISDLNSGWYHSGKTHKKFGFDFTINASVSIVPDKEKSFVFNNNDYKVMTLQNGTSVSLPTLMGPNTTEKIEIRLPIDSSTSQILFDHLNNAGIPVDASNVPIPDFAGFLVAETFDAPDGVEGDLEDVSPIVGVPLPMVQFGLGLPGKTDVKLRFIPSVGNDDVKTKLIGVGLQHNLLQHFLKADKLPIVDLSILGAFTSSTTNYKAKNSEIRGSNQETEIKINAYTVQLVGNVNLKIINFYAGLGYVAGDSTFKVKGTYIYDFDIDDPLNVIPETAKTVTVTDPIDIEYKMDSGIKATLGMRLNLAWFKIFADYSIQEYNTVNAGIAFSFR